MSSNSDPIYQFVCKILGIDITMLLEDSVYLIKREKHPQ